MVTILNSKLHVPDVSETIPRERLFETLEAVSGKKMTTVVGPAGYGKTTLVAQAIRRAGWKSVWFRLGESDEDLVCFLSYLVEGIRRLFPTFGEKTIQRIESIRNPQSEWQDLVTIWINELENEISDGLYFILDDYHRIQESEDLNQTLDFFLEHLPPNLHLIIISRSEPGLSLSRLRSTNELIEIKAEDLAFTGAETDSMCKTLFGNILDDDALQTLHLKTEGWITGLILFYHAVKQKDRQNIGNQIKELKGSSGVISDYLQENVIENLSKQTRDFLLKTSILSRLEVNFCDQYLEIDNSRNILEELHNSRLFTFALDEDREWFYYHQLFQDFLQKRLEREFGRDFTSELQLQAARIFEKTGRSEDALDHYLSANEFDICCDLLEDLVADWKESGQTHLIRFYLEKVPLDFLVRCTWYLPTQAFLASVTIDFKKAIRIWQAVYRQALEQNLPEQARTALLGIGFLHFESGEFSRAERQLQKLLTQSGVQGFSRMYALRTLILTSAAQNKTSDADSYFDDYLDSLNKLDLSVKEKDILSAYVEGRVFVYKEDVSKAVLCGERIINHGFEPRVYHEIFSSYIGMSQLHFLRGDYEEGSHIARQGLELLEETGYHTVFPKQMFYNDLAANCIGLGEIEAAIARLKQVTFYFSKTKLGQLYAAGCLMLGIAYQLSGNLTLAENYLSIAVNPVPGDPQLALAIRFRLLHVFIEQAKYGEVEKAIHELASDSSLAQEQLPGIAALQAHHAFAVGDKSASLSFFAESLAMSKKMNKRPAIPVFSKWAVPLVVEILARGKLKPYLKKHIKLLVGPWARGELQALLEDRDPSIKKTALDLINRFPQKPVPDLRVCFLGKFTVWQGNAEIRADCWKSQKAKMLFKYLVFRRNVGYTPKEVLMELLWPDENAKKSANRFHVALTTIRKTLEPDIVRGASSSYIKRKGDGYCISLGENGKVDYEEFLLLLENGRKENHPETALQYFQQAESIYRGDFLEEDPFADWCSQQREKLRGDLLYVLSWLMDYYESRRDFTLSVAYAEKYLLFDKYAEDVYRRLIRVHLQNENLKKAKQVYERCERNLAEGLDAPVSPETKRMYKQILQSLGN